MAVSTSRERVALAVAAGWALVVPLALLLLPIGGTNPPEVRQPLTPLTPEAPPPPGAAYERPLFAAAGQESGSESQADAPALAGIVGRLGEDAVALVRTADGSTQALRIGESVDGWRLESLAIDAAFFTRGAERRRVPLPAG